MGVWGLVGKNVMRQIFSNNPIQKWGKLLDTSNATTLLLLCFKIHFKH